MKPSDPKGALEGRPARANGPRVAILGGGMGALSCAHELSLRGLQVTDAPLRVPQAVRPTAS